MEAVLSVILLPASEVISLLAEGLESLGAAMRGSPWLLVIGSGLGDGVEMAGDS